MKVTLDKLDWKVRQYEKINNGRAGGKGKGNCSFLSLSIFSNQEV
jgi:hypothetical protein